MQHPRRYVVPITYELASDPRLESSDVRTWIIIAALASDGSTATDDREFISPGRETMARLCNCTINTLRASYDRLKEAGWITELPRHDGHPLRISIKVPQPKIAWEDTHMEAPLASSSPTTLHKMYSDLPTNVSQSDPPLQVSRSTIPQFPADLIRLADSISLKDQEGVPYTLPSIVTLWTYSGRASVDDLRRGLLRLKHYMETDHPVYSVKAIFGRMFSDGRFVVRKRQLGTTESSRGKDLPDSTRVERLQAANDLARGVTVEIGKLDPKLRNMLLEKDALEVRGPHTQLKTNFTLEIGAVRKDGLVPFKIGILTPDGEEEHVPAEVQQ